MEELNYCKSVSCRFLKGETVIIIFQKKMRFLTISGIKVKHELNLHFFMTDDTLGPLGITQHQLTTTNVPFQCRMMKDRGKDN